MLWQLLPEKLFGNIVTTYEAPLPEEVIQLIAQHEKRELKDITAVIVVDGFQEFQETTVDGLDEKWEFYRTLTAFADLAIQKMFIIPCCTATITCSIKNFLRSSHRKRIFLPVASLKPPYIRQDSVLKPVFNDEDYIMKILINDCGGHGRALEVLAECLSQVDISQDNIDELMHELFNRMKDRYKEALLSVSKYANAIARAILTRKPLPFDEPVPETNRLPYEITQPGLIRYEREEDSPVGYLTAPYIWIWLLARRSSSMTDPILRDWRFCDYSEHRSIEDPRSPPGAQFWQHFEHFVASFRCLKSRLIGEGELVTVSEVHAGARLNGDFSFINHHLELECSTYQEDTKSTNRSSDNWEVKCEYATVNIRDCKFCVLNGSSASAGDAFLGLDTGPGSTPINEVHQYKHLKTQIMNENRFKTERDKAASANDFFFLFTTAKDCNFRIPERSGIIDGNNWAKYFGPFAGRAYLYAIEGPLNINSAKRHDLLRMDGIGKTYADQIIKKRPFVDIEDAKAKTNIPERVLKRFKFSSTPV
ncbi:uncharacterized protein VTP21DRAFT_11747 [Calcarisporiella thermophila]|uniref:uncharacterized protein n=1 Tax=Calcarisporiella thermophila TaxID=911321 RepID=UPI0037421AA5